MAASLLACGLLLSGCGGGGGSGGSGGGGASSGGSNPSDFRITLDRTSIAFEYFDGQELPSTILNATSTGTLPTTVYVGATTDGTAIDRTITIVINATTGAGTITMKPAAGLAPGQYNGTVQFLACSDQACNNRIGGTPINVSYSVHVKAGLTVTPNPVTLSAVSGTGASGSVTLSLPEGATAYNVSSTGSQQPFNWLLISDQTANAFTVSARSMPVGTYSASFNVSATPVNKTVTVNYVVSAPPGGAVPLAVSPGNFSLTASEGQSITRTLSVQSPSWGPDHILTSVQYSDGGFPWLVIAPVAGGFTLTANAQGRVAGHYSALITVTTAPQQDQATVQVDFNIIPGLTAPTSDTFKVSSATRTADLQRTVAVPAVNGATLQWSASTTADWLTLTRNQGITGTDSVAYTVDVTKLQSWDNFSDHTALIQITGGEAITPTSFNVTVQKRLAEVNGLGPYLVTANADSRLIVRGRGFSEMDLATLTTNLTIVGLASAPVQLVNDTELTADLHNLSAGTHQVNVANNLGFTLPGKTLTALAPVDFTYTAIPTTEAVGPLLYDAQRHVVYGLDLYEENTHVFRFDGTAWSHTLVPMSGFGELGLRPDGSALLRYTVPAQNTLEELDPITLSLRKNTTLPFGFAARLPSYDGILIGNDSRAWLQELISLTTYNIDTGAKQDVEDGLASYFDQSSFAMSRNGERLIDAPFEDSVPSRNIFYMDSADTVWHDSGVRTYFERDLKINDDGSRVVLDFTTVLNAHLEQLGVLTLPGSATGFQATALPSPNGNRVYVLTVNAAGTGRPTVYVYDTSAATVGSAALPLLGSFDFVDFPTLCVSSVFCGRGWVKSTISPDGHTLFFSGDRNFVVVPIPPAYQ